MTLESLQDKLKQGWVVPGGCVPSALDAVSKRINIGDDLYERSIELWESGAEGDMVRNHYADLYAASGVNPEDVKLITNYDADSIWEFLVQGMRIIGNFVGKEDHVVGIVRGQSDEKNMVDVVGLVFLSENEDGIVLNWSLEELCSHVQDHEFPWVVMLSGE